MALAREDVRTRDFGERFAVNLQGRGQQFESACSHCRRPSERSVRSLGRSFHSRAGVHHDIKANCVHAFGSGLVDHAELKPHCLDPSRSFSAMAWSTTAPTSWLFTKQSTT